MSRFKLTPVMQQYLEIKRDHEDAILFFRMGDFYEMFFEDAEKASPILDIALTSRNRTDPNPIPLCGVPHHSIRPYAARLLEAGLKVAICEQIELPKGGSTIAKRKVTRVITPGTVVDEDSLALDQGNYLVTVGEDSEGWAVAWADFSTGEILTTRAEHDADLRDEILSIAPREIVVESGGAPARVTEIAAELPTCVLTRLDERTELPAPDAGYAPATARSLSVLKAYLAKVQGDRTGHLRAPVVLEPGSFLKLDAATRTNLGLVEGSEGGKRGSLLGVLDRAVTPMAKRLTRRWICSPLADAEAIGERLDAVDFFLDEVERRAALRTEFKAVGDLERLAGRLGAATASPRDVANLCRALEAVERVTGLFTGSAPPSQVTALLSRLDSLAELRGRIGRALVDDPPANARSVGMIRPGYDENVDHLRGISSAGKTWIATVEAEERDRTGIGSLKIGFNKVFGYYIEVSKVNQSRVPNDYERKQTLTNAERYITPALKEKEGEVLGAEERLLVLESDLFMRLLEDASSHQSALAATATAIAELDALSAFAETAHTRGYVRPQIHLDGPLEIKDGRHPVVEAGLGSGFVPNDCTLGLDDRTIMVITGPNMAGKSTYLRQVALISVMAHCGSYVPAGSARIPVMDRVFTRIGASDNLVAGKSTFMVEMSETASILANMTSRSLVVLDEIGRGTSTFDGISIAWAVAEAMVEARVKTLFATHYHELTGLAAEHECATNACVAVKRYRGEIAFLYRVTPGVASGSFGIDVARLAGLPDDVIARARMILENFAGAERVAPGHDVAQMSLFRARPDTADEPPKDPGLLDELSDLDVDRITPLEALDFLSRLVKRVRNER